MPKTTPPEVREEWVKLADQGFTPWQIKRKFNNSPDVRTIQGVIHKDRAERAASELRTEARKHGLFEHWRLLLDSTDTVLSLARRTPRLLGSKRPIYAVAETKLISKDWTASKKNEVWKVELEFNGSVEGRLLREHIESHHLWNCVDSYSAMLGQYLDSRIAFADSLITGLHESTGSSGESSSQCRLRTAGIAVLDEALFEEAIGSDDRLSELLEQLVTNEGGTRIELAGALLVESNSPLGSDIPDAIRDTLTSVRGSSAWKALLAAHGALSRTADALIEEILVMRTVPTLPGTCRGCARIA